MLDSSGSWPTRRMSCGRPSPRSAGYAELYRHGGIEDAEGLDRAMTRIEQEAIRVGSLVEDLLLLARLDERRTLDLSIVDLAQLARDATADLRAVDPSRIVTLDAPQPVVVSGDVDQLRQVFANLLTNARVHTPPATSVHVDARTDGGEAVIVVADEGPGVTPTDRERIFERFTRTDQSRSRASGGFGLGLSIVAAVVAAHGGSVRLEDGDRPGARFVVRLPSAEPDPA